MRCFCKCRSGKENAHVAVLSGAVLLFVLWPLAQSGENHNGGTKTPDHGQLREAITREPVDAQMAESVDANKDGSDDETLIIDESYLENDATDAEEDAT